jgi:hypothetical protein
MRKQRKAADEKKQRAKAAREWRDKVSGQAKSNSLPKRYGSHAQSCQRPQIVTLTGISTLLVFIHLELCRYFEVPAS